jgi:hypothetical protein
LNVREPLFEARDDVAGFVQAESGLRQIADTRRVGKCQIIDIFHSFDQVALFGNFAQSTNHFVVILMPDQHDARAIARESYGFQDALW